MPLKCVALKTPVSPGNVNVWLGFPSYTHLFPLLEVSHRNIFHESEQVPLLGINATFFSVHHD